MPGIQIVGAGNNVSTRVNTEGRMEVVSISTGPEYHANWEHSTCFYLQTSVTPSPSADFLYIKNTSESPLILESIFVSCISDEDVLVYRNPSGSPTGGTETTPSNSNFGSSKQPEGSFIYGGDLGGLSTTELYSTLPCYGGLNNAFSFRNSLILPKNSTISFNARNGDIELDISMPFFYLPGEL